MENRELLCRLKEIKDDVMKLRGDYVVLCRDLGKLIGVQETFRVMEVHSLDRLIHDAMALVREDEKVGVQPPNPVAVYKGINAGGVGIKVDDNGSHKYGVCVNYGGLNAFMGGCKVKEESKFEYCPICGGTDVEIIKEDSQPFGQ